MAQAAVLPVLFVVDRDENSFEVLLSDLSRRFGNSFTVRGETSPDAALAALEGMAAANEPVALLLADDAASDLLAQADRLYPQAKRVLLVDRDSESPEGRRPRGLDRRIAVRARQARRQVDHPAGRGG